LDPRNGTDVIVPSIVGALKPYPEKVYDFFELAYGVKNVLGCGTWPIDSIGTILPDVPFFLFSLIGASPMLESVLSGTGFVCVRRFGAGFFASLLYRFFTYSPSSFDFTVPMFWLNSGSSPESDISFLFDGFR
jgi:hypothetical protein